MESWDLPTPACFSSLCYYDKSCLEDSQPREDKRDKRGLARKATPGGSMCLSAKACATRPIQRSSSVCGVCVCVSPSAQCGRTELALFQSRELSQATGFILYPQARGPKDEPQPRLSPRMTNSPVSFVIKTTKPGAPLCTFSLPLLSDEPWRPTTAADLAACSV